MNLVKYLKILLIAWTNLFEFQDIFVYFQKNEVLSIEVHGFADNSLNAFVTVIYLHVIQENETSVRLLSSKSNVSPMKNLTIP